MKHSLRALAIGILAVAGCDDASEAVRRPDGGSSATTRREATADRRSRCADFEAFEADLDADGRSDRIYHLYLDEESREVLGVCTASGVQDEIDASAPEANGVMDLEPDGRDEILFGGTTVSAVVLSIAVLHDGRLREVELPGSVSLVRGVTMESEGRWISESWGCRDVDGDGVREVVTGEFRWGRDGGRWAGRAYRLTGTKALLVDERWGDVAGPFDIAEPYREMPDAARRYIGESCQRDS